MNRIVLEKTTEQGCRVQLVQGDLTEEAVDAIVNAANSQLAHGGGVAGAIVRKGGQVIQEESWRVAPVPVGHAVITSAGSLKARYVIHTVGPRGGEPQREDKLSSAVQSSLELADSKGLTTISLPAISTGIFGYPMDEAAEVILRTISNFLAYEQNRSIEAVRICIFDENAVDVFSRIWDSAF